MMQWCNTLIEVTIQGVETRKFWSEAIADDLGQSEILKAELNLATKISRSVDFFLRSVRQSFRYSIYLFNLLTNKSSFKKFYLRVRMYLAFVKRYKLVWHYHKIIIPSLNARILVYFSNFLIYLCYLVL